MDIISEHIENMTLEQLKHNARMALLAESYMNADVDGPSNDHEDLARDALANIRYGATRITWEAYDKAAQFGDKPEDVVSVNWERRMLNIVPLTDEWEEQDPKTFVGFLGDNHTLRRPPLDVCANYAARLPWVQINLLHGPLPTETPEFRRLAEEGTNEEITAYSARSLADLAVFTANLPDELFIP